jgi:membrane protein
MLTIDRKLNDIWRVRQARPLAQRILVYWAALTLGPLLVGGSISLTSYVISASKGLVAGIPGGVRLLLNLLELFMATSAITLLFKYVPHVQVKWRHAWIGGILVALGIEGAKRLLAWYVIKVPTYSAVYGTFATIPILLVWLYLLWVIVLLGAVITAYLPQLGELSRQRTLSGAGSDFELAIELIFALHQARTSTESHSLELHQLARQLRTGSAQLEPALLALQALRWIGQLNHASQTYVLLIDIQSTPIAPLCERLLLARTPSTQALWQQSGWGSLPLGHLQHQHPN